jgi:hypothetical protein
MSVSVPQVLTAQEVREYTSDYAVNNYLIEGEEMSDTFIELCMTLAADSFNSITPIGNVGVQNFPSKAILLYGTLWHAYAGKALLLARNTMEYSDGGLQIPIEERAQLYQGLASGFQSQFMEAGTKLKIQLNMENGWGEVRSDLAIMPIW